jgi:chromosome segregation ATPase
MTKETLFQKLKSERQSLQMQVQQLEAQLKDAATARALTKEAAAQQQSRLVHFKDEEVGMLKTHLEELKAHVKELKRAAVSEKLRSKELGEALEEIRDKASRTCGPWRRRRASRSWSSASSWIW